MNEQLSKMSDSKIVELSKTELDIFEELVLRYQERLFRYIKRISYFNNEDAEDIIQEVFIKAYRNLNDYDDSFKFSTWIYRITRNCTIDEIRKKHTHPQSMPLEDEELLKIFKSNINVENEIEIKDHLEKVKKIINDMPFRYKEVLILRFLEEKSYEEMMDILRKPKGTVAALVNRGKKMIAKEAKKQGLYLNQ
ncbi:MAG: sigma-70 family RNA polymerase sigma factor [Patescibacteria group bacterium]|nr:sigma-70 family RNA polymerase sigma factor [Patescibacteria group bacterium]